MDEDVHTPWELPRRYEDTKPAISQAFTHKAIINIGDKLKADERQRNSEDRRTAISLCEKSTWEKAEVYKNDCVSKALKEAKNKEERNIARMKKEQRRELEHEISRVESNLLHQAEERLSEQQSDSNRHLANALEDQRQSCEHERVLSVENARQEERQIASDNLNETNRLHQLAMESQHHADMTQAEKELNDLRNALTEDKTTALVENTLHEQNIANAKIEQLTQQHNAEVAGLKNTIADLTAKLNETTLALQSMESLKNEYVAKLVHNKDAFTKFVEAARPDFHPDQADFLIPINEIAPSDDPIEH